MKSEIEFLFEEFLRNAIVNNHHIQNLEEKRNAESVGFFQTHKSLFAKIENELNITFIHLSRIFTECPSIQDTYSGPECVAIIDHAIRILTTCVNLIERLNFYESLVLLRNIVEACATAIAIHNDNKFCRKFLLGKGFKSPESISISGKAIPEIGRLWGELGSFVHISPKLGTQKTAASEGIIRHYELNLHHIHVPSEKDATIFFDLLESVTYLIGASIEIVFFEKGEYDGANGFYYPNKRTFIINSNYLERFRSHFTLIMQRFTNS